VDDWGEGTGWRRLAEERKMEKKRRSKRGDG
jgi:hypothetical protein